MFTVESVEGTAAPVQLPPVRRLAQRSDERLKTN